MRTPSTPRTVLLALFAALAVFASACGSTQPIEVGIDETDESTDTLDNDDRNVPNPLPEPDDLERTDEGDEGTEPIEVPGPDTSGEFKGTEPVDDDMDDAPNVDDVPLVADEPPVIDEQPEPAREASPISAEDLAKYCATYDALNELGEDDPVSPADAEAKVTEMVELANDLAAATPDHMADSAAEMVKFLETIAELAAAADWDPDWFAGSYDELFGDTGLDFELLETFFDESDNLCLEPGNPDFATPDVLPVEPAE